MKNMIFIIISVLLFGCHKDSSTSTPAPVHSSPPPSIDTATVFLACPGSQTWEDYTGVILNGYWNNVEAPYFYVELGSTNVINNDSGIVYVYNNGWRKLPYYDSTFNTHYTHDTILVYNNDTEKIYNYWYHPYPQDSIMYFWGHTSGRQLPEDGNGFMINIVYEGKHYNQWNYPIPLQLKIFIKPTNSNL